MKITKEKALKNNKDLLNKKSLQYQEIEKLVSELKLGIVYKSDEWKANEFLMLEMSNRIIGECISHSGCLSDAYVNLKSRNEASYFKVIKQDVFKQIFE